MSEWNVLQGNELRGACEQFGLKQTEEAPTSPKVYALCFDPKFAHLYKKPQFMIQKLTSDEYQFTVTRDTSGITVVLTDVTTSTTKVKVFKMSGALSADKVYEHMCSLTDSQCEQWFAAGERKKKKA